MNGQASEHTLKLAQSTTGVTMVKLGYKQFLVLSGIISLHSWIDVLGRTFAAPVPAIAVHGWT